MQDGSSARIRRATRIRKVLIGLAVLSPGLAVAAEPAATPQCKNAGVTVSFASGSTEIDTNGRGALAGVATWLQNGDRRMVRLEGFADRNGGATGNQRLSERRAMAVKESTPADDGTKYGETRSILEAGSPKIAFSLAGSAASGALPPSPFAGSSLTMRVVAHSSESRPAPRSRTNDEVRTASR